MLENTVSAGLDSRSWNQSGSVSSTSSYQNFSGYYSNIDYLGTSVPQQLVGFNEKKNSFYFHRIGNCIVILD